MNNNFGAIITEIVNCDAAQLHYRLKGHMRLKKLPRMDSRDEYYVFSQFVYICAKYQARI